MIIQNLSKWLNKCDVVRLSLGFAFLIILGCQVAGSRDDLAANHKKNPSQSGHSTTASKQSKKTQNAVQDSAPSGPIPTFFKAVKPIIAPLSRYGNPATYHVDGQKYEVLTSAAGYHQRGIASWYGTKFHRKRTSSGEPYDMYALTAAHRTLPLPTYIRVKNLKNGREAIVKVNDRGPFHSGRIIDLSYGAAAKLGIFPQGTAPVEIEALTFKNQSAHYYIQAGSFGSNRLAAELKAKLSKSAMSPVFIKTEKGRFLVRIGPLANRQKAEQVKSKLVSLGVKSAFTMIM